MEYLVIDGYNVINAWSDVFNLSKEPLEDCRDKLCEMMSNYQGYRKVNVIVVFDAHMVRDGQEKAEVYDNLTVIYSKENETADNYIEKFVYRMAPEHVVRVVTSDYLEQRMILSSGGIRMSPRELKEEIDKANKSVEEAIRNRKPPKSNMIMSNLSDELLEKLEKMRRGKF